MILGALIDAGVPFEDVRRALGSLAIADDAVWLERVTRAGVSATKLCVRGEAPPLDHAHDHEHGHDHGHHDDHEQAHHRHHEHEEREHSHVHRSLLEISRLIDQSLLSSAGKTRAKQLFTKLGEVEAAIHGTTLDKVHLHEVGAVDSIIDIVGTVFALEAIGAERIVSSPLNVGSGTIRSAHGVYPVPAPATARLLTDVPIYSGPQNAELVTPTGALLITSYASEYGSIPPMRVKKIGYGAGLRDFADMPNVLRVLIGQDSADAHVQTVTVIEAEIDDMNPQIFGVLMDRLLADGALDVFYTPIQMKKNRPGTLLTVLASPNLRERLTTMIFRETTTIGVRYREMARECLDRETIRVETPFGAIGVKVARRNGEVMNASPEFDDCVRIAAASGTPLKDVQAAAMKSYLDLK